MPALDDLMTPSRETAAAWLRSRCRGTLRARAVLLHAPSFAFQAPGGGENQLVQTGRHLEALGVPGRPFVPWTDRLDRARLLHLFGMSREGLELARRARVAGIPVVLSPICWFEPAALLALEPGPARKARALLGWATRRLAPRLPGWRRELLRLSDLVLPNSQAEARQLVRLFGADPARLAVVPNGVLGSFRTASPRLFRRAYGGRDFVFFAGRIEPRKNPLGLIRATRALGLPLVIAGAAPAEQGAYLGRCRREGGEHVTWLGALAHDDPLLASAYAAARVFALPSWFETPGLAALEAALAGSAVVVTPLGSTREYFGDKVLYARPDHIGHIATAVGDAWMQGPDPRLAEFVASHYLWPAVARRTSELYDQIAH
jgi:glycosyltransferase involved in cell wall biosynthesis